MAECKHRNRLNDSGFCSVACRYCTADQEHRCERHTRHVSNADRIRSMSDEELAKWMRDMMDCVSCRKVMSRSDITCTGNYKECVNRCMDWLRQPAEE